jgi:hypothetical protein
MRWFASSLAVVLVVGWTALGGDDDKAAKEKKDAADKMVSKGTISGKLIKWGNGTNEKTITLQVTVQVPNPGGLQTMANLENQLLDASRDGNPVNRARRINDVRTQMALHQKDVVKDEKVEVELVPSDDLIVRMKDPPVKTDEKGKPRKLTDKEKKELKGSDPKLPGYTASMEDLKNDEFVTVYVTQKKLPKSTTKDKDEKPDNKPTATMIVILLDPPK